MDSSICQHTNTKDIAGQSARWTAALQKCHNGKAHNRLTVITQILGSVGNVKWKYITDCVIKIGKIGRSILGFTVFKAEAPIASPKTSPHVF